MCCQLSHGKEPEAKAQGGLCTKHTWSLLCKQRERLPWSIIKLIPARPEAVLTFGTVTWCLSTDSRPMLGPMLCRGVSTAPRGCIAGASSKEDTVFAKRVLGQWGWGGTSLIGTHVCTHASLWLTRRFVHSRGTLRSYQCSPQPRATEQQMPELHSPVCQEK